MIKYTLVFVLMISLLSITIGLVVFTHNGNVVTLQWIENMQSNKGSAREKHYFSTYSTAYMNALKDRLTQENKILAALKQPLLLAMLIVIIISTLVICFTKATIKKDDGLAVLLFVFALIVGIIILINHFYNQFEQASAATNGLEVNIHISLIVISPLLFLVAGLLHNKEITMGLKHSKWISNTAFGLFLITSLFALFIWFAKSASDLAGNWG
jgi:Na+/glutamate symporter